MELEDAHTFVVESNKIEGIDREPLQKEINMHIEFTNRDVITPNHLIKFVNVYESGAKLRDKFGMDVRVNNHKPIAGNPNMRDKLFELLKSWKSKTPYELHTEYEMLHPFTDCNGRSGRVLWAWHMNQLIENRHYLTGYPLGFLHHFYYQALESQQKARTP